MDAGFARLPLGNRIRDCPHAEFVALQSPFEVANGCVEQILGGFVESADMRPPRHIARDANAGVARRGIIARCISQRFAAPVRERRASPARGSAYSAAGSSTCA